MLLIFLTLTPYICLLQNWQLYIGEQDGRTTNYKTFLINLLRQRRVTKVGTALHCT